MQVLSNHKPMLFPHLDAASPSLEILGAEGGELVNHLTFFWNIVELAYFLSHFHLQETMILFYTLGLQVSHS